MIPLMLSMRCYHDHAMNDINFIIFNNIDIIDAINIFNMIGYHGFSLLIPWILLVDIIYGINDMNNVISASSSKVSIIVVLRNL